MPQIWPCRNQRQCFFKKQKRSPILMTKMPPDGLLLSTKVLWIKPSLLVFSATRNHRPHLFSFCENEPTVVVLWAVAASPETTKVKQMMARKSAASNVEMRAGSGFEEIAEGPKRSGFLWMALLVVLLNSSWAVRHVHFERLPDPLTAEQVGKRGFS